MRDLQFFLDDLSGRFTRYMPEPVRNEIVLLTENCHGDMRERLYWLRNDLFEYPTCLYCGAYLTSKNFIRNGTAGYREYCSKKCAKQDQNYAPIIAKRTQTNLDRYGSSCPWYFENFRTYMKDRFGVEHVERSDDDD